MRNSALLCRTRFRIVFWGKMILHPSCFSITARGLSLSVDQTHLHRLMAGTPFRRFSHASAVTLQSEKLSYWKLTLGVLPMPMCFNIATPQEWGYYTDLTHSWRKLTGGVLPTPAHLNTSAARALSNIKDVTHSWGQSNTCVCIWLAYCFISFLLAPTIPRC